jgi:hypothetical protein
MHPSLQLYISSGDQKYTGEFSACIVAVHGALDKIAAWLADLLLQHRSLAFGHTAALIGYLPVVLPEL